MNVFLSAGEASGDAYASALISEMRRLSPDAKLTFMGIGGKRFEATGAQMVADSSQWGAVSILESLKLVPRVILGYYRAKQAIRRSKPGLMVPIDFGYVNIRLARHAKNHGWKVLYFVPPSSWRRDKQGKDIPKISDAISTPFSWSAIKLKEMGANAHWFGHPILQLLRDRGVKSSPETSERIAVLPGSRSHEIKENLPLLAASVKEPVEFGLAPSVDLREFKAQWERLAPGRRDDKFTQGDVYGVLSRCRAAVVCSGTATLEAALCRCPMVVIYRFPKIAELEAKLVGFKMPEYISLPNLLLQKRIVPELVQWTATPENLSTELNNLLTDPQVRAAQIQGFTELEALLGEGDASSKTAELAFTLVA